MRLDTSTLALLIKEDPATIECLDLDNLRIDRLREGLFQHCTQLVSIDLSGNSLQSLQGQPFKRCSNAWWINLSNNQLDSLVDSGLGHFLALGALDLGYNSLSLESLAPLASVHVLQLTLKGNSKLSRVDCERRRAALDALQVVWVVDGHFVLESGPDRGDNPSDALAIAALSELGDDQWDCSVAKNEKVHLLRYQRVLKSMPKDPRACAQYKLEKLVDEYNVEVTTQRQWIAKQIFRNKPRLLPRVEIDALLAAQPTTRLDLCVLVGMAVHLAPVPRRLLREALGVLLSSHQGCQRIDDIVGLPPFVRTAVAHILREATIQERDNGCYAFDTLQLELIDALPEVFVERSGSSSLPKPSTLLARRFVTLLSRAPPCSTTSNAGKSSRDKLTYKSIEHILRAANLSSADVHLVDNCVEAPVPAPPHEQSASLLKRIDGVADRPDYSKLRAPRIGEQVEVAPGKFARVAAVTDSDVQLDHAELPPVIGSARVDRSSVFWDPRGWWRHTLAVVAKANKSKEHRTTRLFRPNLGLNEAGRARCAGVPNLSLRENNALPTEHMCHRPNVVSLFSAEASLDAAFVVASQGAISAQNNAQAAHPNVMWSTIESALALAAELDEPMDEGGPRAAATTRTKAMPSEQHWREDTTPLETQDTDDADEEALWMLIQRSMGSQRAENVRLRKTWPLLEQMGRFRPAASQGWLSHNRQRHNAAVFELTALPTKKTRQQVLASSSRRSSATRSPAATATQRGQAPTRSKQRWCGHISLDAHCVSLLGTRSTTGSTFPCWRRRQRPGSAQACLTRTRGRRNRTADSRGAPPI